MYAQKRLACYTCHDKKLKCTTIRGDSCERCRTKRIECQRPKTKRVEHRVGESLIENQRFYPLTPPLTSGRVAEAHPPSSSIVIESAERLFWTTLQEGERVKDAFSHAPRYDLVSVLDPILNGILTIEQAQSLFAEFHRTFGKTLAYFDVHVCTFDHIRARSHALLATICLVMTRAHREMEEIGKALDRHMQTVILPAILLQGFRSTEIVQALLMLAGFEKPSETVREDRSWTLLSHAGRIASEMNMQASFEVAVDDTQDSQRTLRSTQRAWINLWLHEFSLAQHTGRRCVIAEQDLFALCAKWHEHPLASPSDRALVSMVELRSIIKQSRTLYERLTSDSDAFYVAHCKSNLRSWEQRWSVNEQQSGMPRLELSTLYVNHALVQLIVSVPSVRWTSSITLDLYTACSAYLNAFPVRLPAAKLMYCYNSMFVAATYESLVAIRLADLHARYGFIDVDTTYARCWRVWQCIDDAAQRSSSTTAANSYARFLEGVLRRFTSKTRRRDVMLTSAAAAAAAAALVADQNHDEEQSTEQALPSASLTEQTMPLFGFDDLELFAWAGGSLAQSFGSIDM